MSNYYISCNRHFSACSYQNLNNSTVPLPGSKHQGCHSVLSRGLTSRDIDGGYTSSHPPSPASMHVCTQEKKHRGRAGEPKGVDKQVMGSGTREQIWVYIRFCIDSSPPVNQKTNCSRFARVSGSDQSSRPNRTIISSLRNFRGTVNI